MALNKKIKNPKAVPSFCLPGDDETLETNGFEADRSVFQFQYSTWPNILICANILRNLCKYILQFGQLEPDRSGV